MASVTEKWRTERFSAAVYDAAVEHERVARVAGSAMWAADTRKLFAYIARAAGMPAGSSILDVPCGGGLGFRGLRQGQDVRYVAADISPYMLQRARKEARHRHVEDQIEFVAGDITALEFPDASFDLCVTYNGLHCLPDPRAALTELGRVLKPGGTLRGTSCVTGRALRSDALIAIFRRVETFGNTPRAGAIETWLTELGFEHVAIECSGAIEFFEAQLPKPRSTDEP
jgi:ubiquinone/menaquinone biosynthesis C-methylase UbiE